MRNLKSGNAFKYGDDVDTDVIIPARYLNTSDPEELKKHCMEDIDKTFYEKVQENDFIIAGDNFGCGSSREHAPIAIKANKVSAVIAKSFARIFYRNAINIGLIIIESKDMPDETKSGDKIEMDIQNGVIKNLTTNKTYPCTVFPKEIQELIDAGGLVNYTKKKLGV